MRHLIFLTAMTIGLLVLCCLSSASASQSSPFEASFDRYRRASTYDQSQVPDRPRKDDVAKKPGEAGVVRRNSDWLGYDFQIDKTGWYELYLVGTPAPWNREVFIDGHRIHKGQLDAQSKLPDNPKACKVRSLHLAAGKHNLRYVMQVYPGMYLEGWGLRRAKTPLQQIHATLDGNAIDRLGSPRHITLEHAAFAVPVTLKIIAHEDISKKTFTLASTTLPANSTQTKLDLKLPLQGSYTFIPQVDGKDGTPADLGLPMFGAIDTPSTESYKPDVKKTLIWDIDCVANTRNGKPVVLNETFWEANGPTRIHKSPAGTYRESDAIQRDNPVVSAHGEHSLSAFSYAIDVPEAQVPYMLEVDYPDDTRRTTNIVILEKAVIHPRHGYPMAQLGSGYETGDAFELTNQMKTHQVYFWPSVKEIRAALVSIYDGQRSAASRIRLYKLDEGLPDPVKPYAGPITTGETSGGGGRTFASYYEERRRWDSHQRAAYLTQYNAMSRDIIGIDRWLRQSRAVGMNGISPTEVVYRGATYNSDAMYGYDTVDWDIPRIGVLLAEKYHMTYSPEVHFCPRPTLDNLVKQAADNPDDVLLYSRTGSIGVKNNYGPGFNPLHPAVQDRSLMFIKELAQILGDSPAFDGINMRLMTWAGNSWYWMCSLNWGYGDWTLKQFEKDTGIKVPLTVAADSLQRFDQRYRFLTADNMKARWIAWRNGRMLDYIRRMRDCIVKINPRARLIFTGSANLDYIFEHDPNATTRQLLRDAGFDVDALSKKPHVSFVHGNQYGRAKTASPIEDQGQFDKLYFDQKRMVDGAPGQNQKITNTYFEVHERVPVDKLGLPGYTPKGYCGAAEGAGRMALEKLAIPLAQQDTLHFTQGGLGYVWGQPSVYVPWLNAFTALPAVPFDRVEHVGDVVTVRQKQIGKQLYGYMVNCEPYAATVTLDIHTDHVTTLSTDKTLNVIDGKLAVTLDAFELLSFRTDQPATITAVTEQVPSNRIALLKNRLAQCQTWQMQMRDGQLKGALDAKQLADFDRILAESWECFASQDYWRTRHLLGSQPMLEIYQVLGRFPENQLGRDFPLLLTIRPTGKYQPANPPLIDAGQLIKHVNTGATPQLVESSSINPDWGGQKVLLIDNQLQFSFDVPFDGQYRIALGHVRPESGAMMMSLNGRSLPVLARTMRPNVPEQTALGVMTLKAGTSTLTLQGTGQIGVYALNVEPVYTAISSEHWQVLGPFPSAWYSSWQTNAKQAIHDAMVRIDPPMNPLNLQGKYENAFGRQVGWSMAHDGFSMFNQWGVNFLTRLGITEGYISFAATHIVSPDDRQVQLLIGSDWWSNAYLNGKLIVSQRKKEAKADGAQFNGWKPTPAVIQLHKGVNTLMVKHHGGSAATWFTTFITDPGDLRITANMP